MKKKRKSKYIKLGSDIRYRYNPELDKYEGKVLFPKKQEQANEILRNTKFPDNFFSDKSKKPL